MTISYNTLNLENQSIITEKARTRKDGVFTFRGVAYAVKNNCVFLFAVNGEVIQPCGSYNVMVGQYDIDGAKALLKFMKEAANGKI